MFSNPFNRALLFQFITVFLLVTMNFSAKYLADTFSTVEILFYRNSFCFIAILFYLLAMKRYALFKTKKPWLHVKRSISGNMSVYFVFSAFALLPMADMTALLSSVPLVATILAVILLGEKTRLLSWVFIVIGMVGVVFIAQPSGDVSLEGMITAFISIFFIAWTVNQLREMGRTENTITTVFYFYLFGTIATAPFALTSWQKPSQEAIIFFLICATAGLISQLLKTEAIKFLPVSIVSPMTHLGLIWAAIYGYIFFDEIPGQNVIIGAVIIMVSSLLLLRYKEKRKKA